MRGSRRQKLCRGQAVLIGFLLITLALVVGLVIKPIFFDQELAVGSKPEQVTSLSGHQHQTSSSAISPKKWQKQEQPVRIPILMYHAVHDMAPEEAHNANLIVSPAVFEAHVVALKEAGYHFLTPAQAYRALTENALPAEKVVWLTFDDSLWDFYEVAYPILVKHGATGTNNVITNRTAMGQAGHLTPEQIVEMAAAGLTFEGHTASHPDLSQTVYSGQMAELTDSKAYLDQLLQQDTMTIVYPAGRYNETTLEVAEQAGYQLGLTTNEGLASLENGLLSLNRVRILPTTRAQDLLEYIGH